MTLMSQVNDRLISIDFDRFSLLFQTYRHVDNIMFENGNLVNRFLEYWRQYTHQRIGFLYGRYEAYDGVPLGVRAVIAAIYEPPQVR